MLSLLHKLLRAWVNCLLLTVVLLHAAGPASRAQSVKPTPPQSAPAAQALAEGEQLWAEGRAEAQRKALKKYEQARVLWHAAGALADEAHAWWLIGDAHQQLGAAQTALTCYEQALRLSQAARDGRREIEALNGLASVNILLGKYPQALELCDKALALSRREQYSRGEADALNNMGDAYSYRGQPRQALDYYNRALPLWQALGDRRGLAQTFLCLGYAQSDLSELKQATDFYQQALALWQAARDVRGQALTLTAIAHIHNKLDDKQVALGLYNQARLLFQLIEDRLGEARILNGIGYIYTGLNKPKEAIEYYDQALQLCRSRSSQCELYNTIRLGQLNSSIGAPQRALGYYQSALNLANTLSDQRSKAYVLRNMGTVREATGDIKAALDYYQQALTLDGACDDRLGTALTLTNIGNAYATAGDVQQAVEHFTKALELNRAILSPTGELQTLYGLARVERSRGDLAAARTRIEAALKISDTLRTKVAGQDMRASYSTTVHQQYEFYVDVLMRLHGQQPAGRFEVAAFEASERGRARSLIESLAEGRKDIRQGVDAELLRRERELQQQLNVQAEQQFKLARRKATTEEWAALERSLNALTREYQQVQGHIRASSPRYAALVQPAPLTLAEMQQQVLDADTVLLEYALGQERSFVWAVTPDAIKSFELPARAQVEQAARRVYELLTARNRQVPNETALQWQARIRQAETDYTVAAQALARMLLGPVAGELGQKRIVVVADGALQYVPFAALPTSGDVPLIAEHEVVSLPSAGVLAVMRAELRGRTPAPKSVAVLADPVFDVDDERLTAAKFARGGSRRTDQPNGNPNAAHGALAARVKPKTLRSFDGSAEDMRIARLPFSQREAEAIMASVLTGDGLLASGFRASRATATGPDLSHYRIVHFATHGRLNSEHPELSDIVLSLFDEAGNRQDGFLQLHEVYNLNLPADLVVLSACQTALGQEVQGEGLVGLTRGFMYAGAARVVASLWKVDDAATAKLMGEFYRAMLRDGLRPAAALRAAQVQMWRQNQWRSPYYWAAFTLQGEWR